LQKYRQQKILPFFRGQGCGLAGWEAVVGEGERVAGGGALTAGALEIVAQ
jgi:hypothetical protein